MADAPEYQRGQPAQPGAVAQLPQGEATDLNRATAAIPQNPAGSPLAEPAPAEPEAGPPGPPPPQAMAPEMPFTPGSDAERHLTAPTAQPTRPVTPLQGIQLSDFGDWMPALQAAAGRADASPQVKALFSAVMLGPLP